MCIINGKHVSYEVRRGVMTDISTGVVVTCTDTKEASRGAEANCRDTAETAGPGLEGVGEGLVRSRKLVVQRVCLREFS